MSVALTQFIKEVRGSAPTCPDAIVKNALREAAIEFCKRSKLVTDTIEVTTADGTSEYAVANADGFIPCEVQIVEDADGGSLDNPSVPEFEAQEDDTGDPVRFIYVGDQLVVHPTPTTVAVLKVTGPIRPADDSTTVPDELYNNWRKEIAAGAKAIIHSEYDVYLSADKYNLNRNIFDGGVFRAGVKRAKGGSSRPLRTTSRYF